jgi:addiction module HigA family antidote
MSIPRDAVVDYAEVVDRDARRVGPIHPGTILEEEEFLRPIGLSAYALAKAISVPRKRITGILHGERAITADTALRLGRFFGMSAEFWLDLQLDDELETAREVGGPRLDREVTPRSVILRSSPLAILVWRQRSTSNSRRRRLTSTHALSARRAETVEHSTKLHAGR